MNSVFLIVISIIVFVLLIYIILYNGIINKKNEVERGFSTVDVSLKKRFDLIPNLLATAEKFMNHEKELLSAIVKLREHISESVDQSEKFNLENELSGKLKQLNIQVENYPDLKSNTNFLQLQRSLNEVEEQISASRRSYNAAVLNLNNASETLPSNIVFKTMSVEKKEFFKATEIERNNVIIN